MSSHLTTAEDAVRRLFRAKAALREAKAAHRAAAAQYGPCTGATQLLPNASCWSDAPNPEDWWCASCLGRQPAWRAQQRAGYLAAAALRAVLAVGKRLEGA